MENLVIKKEIVLLIDPGILSNITSYLPSFISLNNSYVKNIKEVEAFLTKCGNRDISFKFIHNNLTKVVTGNFSDNIFKIYSVNYDRYYLKNEEILGMNKVCFNDLVKFIDNNKMFLEIFCTLKWLYILNELSDAEKIKYTYVAEDKRSGSNLIKYLEINGRSVEHDVFRDLHEKFEYGQFYKVICDLYDRHKAPSYAKESVIYFIWCQKKLGFLCKDIIILIAKLLWESRNEKIWCRNNVKQLMDNKQSIKILY